MLENLLERAVQLLWGRGTIAFTLLCGLYFTAFTHFLPLRQIGLVTKKTLGSLFCQKESKDSVSPFAAVSTALGGTMGVGNIIGVGTAIVLGGPGAVLWCWLTGVGRCGQHLLDVGRRAARDDDQIYGGLSGGPMAGAPSRFPLLLRRSDVLLCARHPTSHRQAAGGAVLHLLYPLEPVQRQHGSDQRHRPVDAAKFFCFSCPVRCGTGAGMRVGAARRL